MLPRVWNLLHTLLYLLLPFSVWMPVCLCARHRSFSQHACSPQRLGRPFASVFTVTDISEHVSENEASVHSSPETDTTSPGDSSPGLKLWRPWVCKVSAEGLHLGPALLPKLQLYHDFCLKQSTMKPRKSLSTATAPHSGTLASGWRSEFSAVSYV